MLSNCKILVNTIIPLPCSIAKLSHMALEGSTRRTSFVQFWGEFSEVFRMNQNMSIC